MKKLIISSYDDVHNPHYGGGGARAVHEIAKGLVQRFHVVVLTGSYTNSKNEIMDGVSYRRIGWSFLGPKVGQLFFQLLLPFYMIRTDFDIWLENFTPPFSTSFLPLLTHRPVIGLVHMLSAADMERKYKLPFHFIENIGLKTYNKFIVPSIVTKEKILRANSKAQIAVIPNGIYMPKLGKAKKGKHLLFMGRIEVNQKGLDLLIPAYKKVQKQVKLPLVIAGTGEHKQIEGLKKIIQREKLNERIKLVGRVESVEKDILLKESVCLIVPSRFETFSLTCLEGLAYGLPIVTYDIDGLSWIPKPFRKVAKPFSVDDLAIKITGAMQASKEKNGFDKEKINFAFGFNWSNAVEQYSKFITV